MPLLNSILSFRFASNICLLDKRCSYAGLS